MNIMFRKTIPVVLVLSLASFACSKDPEVAKREFVRSGDAYAAEGKDQEAIIEYRNAVQQDARYGEARNKLADAYRRTGDLTNALKESVRAADILANDAEAQVEAGEMLLLARQFEEAQSRADKALTINPKYVEALILRANALAGLKKFEDAVAEVEEAIRNEPDRITSYASLGLLQLATGERTEAEASFLKAVQTDPSSVYARLALAHFYWSVGRRNDAEAQLKSCLDLEPKNPLANRMMALLHIGSGRRKEAEPFLKAMAEGDSSVNGKLTLADYYVAGRRIAEARAILDEVAKSGSEGFAKATLRLAGIGAASNDFAASEKLVDEVLTKEPADVDALLVKTLMLMRQGKTEEALSRANAAVRAEPRNASAQFSLAQVLLRRGDEAGAIKAFQECLRLNPRMARAELQLARIHLSAGRFDEAEHFAQTAVSKVGGAVEAHVLLASVHIAQGKLSTAEPILRAMEKALPRNASILSTLGQLEYAKRNWSGARQMFARALAEDPENFESLKGILAVDVHGKRGDEAKGRLEAALRAHPDEPRMLLLAGRVHDVLGDKAQAEVMWRKAIELDSDNLAAYVELARLYRQQNRLPEAVTRMEQLLKANPNSILGHTFLGMLLQAQNKMPEAQRHYETAVDLDSRAAVAANNLSMIYTQSGTNLDRAVQLAQMAKSKLADRPEVADTLGWAYYRKGLFNDAVSSFSESVRLEPANAKYHYRLGMAQVSAGDPAKARLSLNKALSLSSTFDGADDARKTLASLN